MKHPYELHTWNSLNKMQGFDRTNRKSVSLLDESARQRIPVTLRSGMQLSVRFIECAVA